MSAMHPFQQPGAPAAPPPAGSSSSSSSNAASAGGAGSSTAPPSSQFHHRGPHSQQQQQQQQQQQHQHQPFQQGQFGAGGSRNGFQQPFQRQPEHKQHFQQQQQQQQQPYQQQQQQQQQPYPQYQQYPSYPQQGQGDAYGSAAHAQQPQQQQQQSQQQSQQPGIGFGATMSNEFNQIGANMGVNPLVMGVADAGLKTAGERMRAYIPGLSGAWHALRYHFDVDNIYVLNKIKLLLFPRQTNWNRHIASDPGDTVRSRAPAADMNAPDLYLPVMGFITFSLLAGLLQGTMGRFDPAYIQSTIMWSATLIAIEAVAARISVSSMALNISSMSFLDFVCYSGYRYFGLCLILLVEMATSGMALPYYVVLVWVGLANSLFIFQSLKATIKRASHGDPSLNAKGAMALAVVYAVLQFVFMWWLSAYNMDGLAVAGSSIEGSASESGEDLSSVASDAAAAIAEASVPSAAPGPAEAGNE